MPIHFICGLPSLKKKKEEKGEKKKQKKRKISANLLTKQKMERAQIVWYKEERRPNAVYFPLLTSTNKEASERQRPSQHSWLHMGRKQEFYFSPLTSAQTRSIACQTRNRPAPSPGSEIHEWRITVTKQKTHQLLYPTFRRPRKHTLNVREEKMCVCLQCVQPLMGFQLPLSLSGLNITETEAFPRDCCGCASPKNRDCDKLYSWY